MSIFPSRCTTAAARRRPSRRARYGRSQQPLIGLEALESRLALAIAVDVFDNTNLGTAGAVYITGHGIPGAPGASESDLRVLAPTGSFVQAAVQIQAASCTGSTARITTAAAHQLKVNDKVCVDGVGLPGYNGVFTVTGVQSGAQPTWFEYTVPSSLLPSAGGAAYLPALLSTQSITAATIDAGGTVTVTLSGAANLPQATPISITGLSGGSGVGWNGMFTVTQNAQTNPALQPNQFQYTTSGSSATATVTAGSQVTIVALAPVSIASLPKNAATQLPSVRLDDTIATYSAQLVPIVTSAGQAPFPLGITSGTINIANYNPAPFSTGEQVGNSVFDIVEFFFAGSAGHSTFDVSQVDGFALPLTLTTSPANVTQGPHQVGLNPTLANLSREQIGKAFTAFIGNESTAVRTNAQFGRLLYDSGLSASPLTVAPASQTGRAVTGVSLQPGQTSSAVSTFTGSIAGTTLNVTAGAAQVGVNQIIQGAGVVPNTYVTHIGSINPDGSGTFTVNRSQTVLSTSMQGYNPTGVIMATKAANGLVPGQFFAVSGTGSPAYDGLTFQVLTTPLNDNALSSGQFTFTVGTNSPPAAIASATVTPTVSGVIASGTGNLVVTVTSGTLPTAGSTVQLSGVPNGTFPASAGVNAPYTVQNPPPGSGLPANAVYLATTTGQTFSFGDSSGGGTLSTPVFVAPPAVPGNQFFVIAAPKDWLANQPVAVANVDPMVTWWDATIGTLFSAGNYLQVAVGNRSYTGVFNGTGYDFYSGLATSGTKAFTIDPPTPQSVFGTEYTTQSQSLANATWVWGQAVPRALAQSDQALVQDQIWGAFCRGVVLDGVLKAPPVSTGQSNTLWTDPTKWYTEHTSTAFPGFTSVSCPFSKFLHYGTLTGGTDRTGVTSIYQGNLAYGFSEDETPYGANGQAIATATASKMDQTVKDGATMKIIVNPWNGGTPQAPYVTSIETIPAQNPPGTPTPTSASTLSWTVSFSEPVMGVTPDDFISGVVSGPLGLGIKSVTATSGTALSQTWTVTGDVVGAGTGVIGVNLDKAGSITDASGTPLTLPATVAGQTYAVTTNPVGPSASITIAGTNPTNAASVPFTVTFSQAVTGLSAANFTTVATGGVAGTAVQSVQVVSGSGNKHYTVIVNTGSGSGTLALRLASAAGLTPVPTGLPVSSAAYTIDKSDPTKAPEVQGIALAGSSPTTAASVSWTVTFSEPVTGVTAANFALATSGLVGTPAITSVTPAGSSSTATWTVSASTGSGSGTLGLQMMNSTNVRDADSQAVTNVPFAGAAYTVDRTAPVAQSIVRANASPTSLSVVGWTVTFSEAVTGLSKENFQLAAMGIAGAQIMQVAPAGGSGPPAVWTVTAATGSGVGTLRLDLVNASGITDAVGLAPTGIPLAGQAYTVNRGGATTVDVPIAFMTTMGTATPLRWLMKAFTDRDSTQLTATLSATPGTAAGTFRAVSGGGVTVTPSGTAAAELTFTGTAANLNAYFRNAAGLIRYTPAGSSLVARSLTLSAQGSDGLAGFATAALLVRAAAVQSPAPTLNASARLAGTAGQPRVITYAQLVAATGATQTASRSVQFMLAGPPAGRLEVWNGGRWIAMPAIANIPLLAPGGRIRWTPPARAAGVWPAFSVKAWDGWRMSGPSNVAVNLAR